MRECDWGSRFAPESRCEPCAQQLEAQGIAVMVLALAAAEGGVNLWARTPPCLKAVIVDPLGGAAAGAGLHERAVLLAPEAQPARPLLRIRSGALALRHEVPRAPPRWGLRLVVLEPAFVPNTMLRDTW